VVFSGNKCAKEVKVKEEGGDLKQCSSCRLNLVCKSLIRSHIALSYAIGLSTSVAKKVLKSLYFRDCV